MCVSFWTLSICGYFTDASFLYTLRGRSYLNWSGLAAGGTGLALTPFDGGAGTIGAGGTGLASGGTGLALKPFDGGVGTIGAGTIGAGGTGISCV